ncbi:hypothetical protein PBT90_14480 [Algoriphagus halophytocola]|uniref:hypothetical protein n=1 Tax=Algoriphagus halophytocola TaxID=2991499 RepID=UPI0022DDE28A|nr:hypothetical protein [Algoriphagus sp. TR-M9]WBL41957.1 hypothetical protein PBT90_14480 [Algoriphagus sp. TR-M9]
MTFNLKQKISNIFIRLQCSLLFMRNLVFAKKITLKQISYVKNLVVSGNKSELLWIVSGCHKIYIKGFGIIPGNTSGINFKYQSQQNSLKITFFGIRHKVTKEVLLEASSLEITNKFIHITIISQPISIPLAHQKLRCVLAESTNIIIDMKTPRITPQNLKIQHEPFEKFNYLTKKK